VFAGAVAGGSGKRSDTVVPDIASLNTLTDPPNAIAR
jgi:hypothetical protein